MTGIVVQQGDKALKKLRRYTITEDMSATRRDKLEWLIETSRWKIENEMQVYQHLGDHDGIIRASFKDNFDPANPIIVMPFMKNGDLQRYISRNELDEHLQVQWIRSLATTLAFCHRKHVLVADISSRNCLLAKDLSLKLCDFGESSIIQPHLNMTEVNDDGVSIQTDIAQFGSVVYEIMTRINLSDPRRPRLHFVEDNKDDEESEGKSTVVGGDVKHNAKGWPQAKELPSTENIRFGAIVQRCWLRDYNNIDEVSEDLST